MNIRCAHCKDRHDTVVAVKECSMKSTSAVAVLDKPAPAPTAVAFKPVQPVTTPGMYRKVITTARGVVPIVYRVRKSKTGNLYAESLVQSAPGHKGRFIYAPGAVKALTADMKMTLEQAAAYGHAYGVCCICGALLSDPKSVEQGIGPVCIKKI